MSAFLYQPATCQPRFLCSTCSVLTEEATRVAQRACLSHAGFNCAEAVNFGPPDWLPFGSDRAHKYRDDAKPLTLSHDALLVTLVGY